MRTSGPDAEKTCEPDLSLMVHAYVSGSPSGSEPWAVKTNVVRYAIPNVGSTFRTETEGFRLAGGCDGVVGAAGVPDPPPQAQMTMSAAANISRRAIWHLRREGCRRAAYPKWMSCVLSVFVLHSLRGSTTARFNAVRVRRACR